jgi:hypothetical protein
MSVYKVYTSTAKIPVYALYKCPHCGKTVVTIGRYGVSESYSDRGTWTKSGVQKRADAAHERLNDAASSQAEQFSKRVYQGKMYYAQTEVVCPACSYQSFTPENAKKMGKPAKILQIAVPTAIILLMLITYFIAKDRVPAVSSILPGYIITAVIAYFAIGAIGKKITFSKAQNAYYDQCPPLICADRGLLRNESENKPEYRDADFSYVEKYPKVLGQKTN